MRDNTVMIVMPEHGRDLENNSIKDLNDWFAYDHSEAQMRGEFSH